MDKITIMIIIILIVVFGAFLFTQIGSDGGVSSVTPQYSGGGCGR